MFLCSFKPWYWFCLENPIPASSCTTTEMLGPWVLLPPAEPTLFAAKAPPGARLQRSHAGPPAYHSPWGIHSSSWCPARSACSSPTATLGARRALTPTPASPCPPARWCPWWWPGPAAGAGATGTSSRRGCTPPSCLAVGGTWRARASPVGQGGVS